MNLVSIFASIAQQSEDTTALIGGLVGLCCGLIIVIIYAAAMWKIFSKAGKPGWAGLIPFYNWYVTTEIVGREVWWIALYWFFPPIWVMDLGVAFGRPVWFGLLSIFLGPIPMLMLGFGGDEYKGPVMKGVSFY